MNVVAFENLSEIQQAELVRKTGVLIAKRTTHNIRSFLYQIEGIYVEVFFNLAHSTIQGMRSFDNMRELDPFLANIELPEDMYARF